jgi:hypothetical protein
MTENITNIINPEVIQKAEQLKEPAKTFYEENAEAIKIVVFVGGILLLNRRMVRKVVRREISDAALMIVGVIDDLAAPQV